MLAAVHELRERPRRLLLLLACAVGVVLHQWVEWDWFIDDAAIVFSYARTLVLGEGVVPWPGAERVEGFSDPTWWLLIALFQAFGYSGFETAKPMAMALGVLTLVPVWRLAREAMPQERADAALLAPFLLALNPQFAIWSASGLENALFCFLLAVAVHRTVIEARTGGFPWASVAYLLLAWTRPEGIVYAAVGGAWFLAWTWHAGRSLRPVGWWLLCFWGPSVALEALRIWYFAWPLPNTYYAKVEARGAYPLEWDHRGWAQLREYAGRLWQGFYLPVYVVGLVGPRGRRAGLALSVVALLALSLLWPGPEKLQRLELWPDLVDPPRAFVVLRVIGLYAAGALLPMLALGAPGSRPRILCWHSALVGLVFAISANGDWMGAYRWVSLVSPVASVLLAVGLIEVAGAIERRVSGQDRWGTAGWLVFSFGAGLLLPPSLSQTRDHAEFNRNETPEMIRIRAEYRREIANRLFFDGEIVNLDMDMGGALWWSPDHHHVDMGMLVDVPMARHWYQQRGFIQEYALDGARPTFAHVHGWWAKHSGLTTYDSWERDFFELPPYDDVPLIGPHPGMWARRDLVVGTDVPFGLRVVFEDALVVEDVRIPVRQWAAGHDGYVEVPISSRARAEDEGEPQLIVFLAGQGRVESWELALGAGLLPMAEWREGEVFRGRQALRLPADLPRGEYDLGFVAFGADGRVLDVLDLPEGVTVARDPADAVYATGEVRLPRAVTVTTFEAVAEAALATRDRALDAAGAGACDDAVDLWVLTKRHRPRDGRWQRRTRPRVARAVADCLARTAAGLPDAQAAARLADAHRWDHRSPELARVGAPLGERLWAEGRAARDAGDHEVAFARFEALLGFQPWRAWARRWAEEARDHRLGLTGDVRVGFGGADDLRPSEGESSLQE